MFLLHTKLAKKKRNTVRFDIWDLLLRLEQFHYIQIKETKIHLKDFRIRFFHYRILM